MIPLKIPLFQGQENKPTEQLKIVGLKILLSIQMLWTLIIVLAQIEAENNC